MNFILIILLKFNDSTVTLEYCCNRNTEQNKKERIYNSRSCIFARHSTFFTWLNASFIGDPIHVKRDTSVLGWIPVLAAFA